MEDSLRQDKFEEEPGLHANLLIWRAGRDAIRSGRPGPEILLQKTGPVGRDSVDAGPLQPAGFLGCIDGPDINAEARLLDLSDVLPVDDRGVAEVDPVQSGLFRFAND